MRIWRFTDPSDYRYARASRRGTWKGTPSERVPPLIIEWEPGSDVVGDFTWPGFDSEIAVTGNVVRALLAASVRGFEAGPVVVIGAVASSGPSRPKRVAVPYAGSPLSDLWVTSWASIDPRLSTVTERNGFPVAVGIERIEAKWDGAREELVKRQHPRVQGQGLVVHGACGIFRVVEFPGWIFCTDDVKELIERERFTNVSFLEVGDTDAL